MADTTTKHPEPERELVRRALPFAAPSVAAGALAGALVGGWDDGWSAGIGVLVVFANLAANGLVLAWAARISLQALYAAALGGFVLRMAVIAALLFVLDRFPFFSPLAFLLAVVPATVLLLGYEMKLLAAGVGSELVIPASGEGADG